MLETNETNEKVWKCGYRECDAEFEARADLFAHLQKAHGENHKVKA